MQKGTFDFKGWCLEGDCENNEVILKAQDHIILPFISPETRVIWGRTRQQCPPHKECLCVHNMNSHREIVRSWLGTLPGAGKIGGLQFWHLTCYEAADERMKEV